MEEQNTGIRIFAILIIVYGVINLFGVANYNDLKLLCAGLPQAVIFSVYIFGVLYGIICIMCGSKMLKLEDWARKTAILFVSVSFLLGLVMNPFMLKNLKVYYATRMQSTGATLEMVIGSYKLFSIIFTVFELAFIYFFTRPKVMERFR